jgi:hypothetical protein
VRAQDALRLLLLLLLLPLLRRRCRHTQQPWSDAVALLQKGAHGSSTTSTRGAAGRGRQRPQKGRGQLRRLRWERIESGIEMSGRACTIEAAAQ